MGARTGEGGLPLSASARAGDARLPHQPGSTLMTHASASATVPEHSGVQVPLLFQPMTGRHSLQTKNWTFKGITNHRAFKQDVFLVYKPSYYIANKRLCEIEL